MTAVTDTTTNAIRLYAFLERVTTALRESNPTAPVTVEMIAVMAAIDEDRTAYAGDAVYKRLGLQAEVGAVILARVVGEYLEEQDGRWDDNNAGADYL